MKKGWFIGLWMVCFFCAGAQNDGDYLKQIRQNYIQSLFAQDQEKNAYLELLTSIPREKEVSDQNIVELYQRYPVRTEEIKQLIAGLQADGSWKDINYADQKRSGWEPKKHAERILKLAKYSYEMQTRKSDGEWDSLQTAIHRALNFWFQRKFSCLNWWYNQIGIPRTLGPAFLLLEEELSPSEKELAIREMKYSRFGMTGQNKVWLAGNVLVRGLLENDYLLVKAARDTIVSEIVLGRREGIKSDWSFHQHGAQQQMGNYGLSFLSNMCAYAELFNQTPLALSLEQRDVLFSFFQQGYRWFVWKGYMDINALDRQLFHNASIHKAYTLLFAAYSLLKGSTPEQAREIKEFIQDNFGDGVRVDRWIGNKVFWESDETVHRTPHWMVSVKMASSRVIGSELVNEDNKKGLYLADGAMYIYRQGDEYLNVFPFWDWRKVPGITCKESSQPVPMRSGATVRNLSSFVGGVTDGQTGITAMELKRDGVHAHKAWIFTDDYVLCLGNDIRGEMPLTTAVEQLLESGELWMKKGIKPWESIREFYQETTEPVYFYHHGTGYIIMQADTCAAKMEERSGQWFDIMGMYKPQMLQKKMVTLYIKHRQQQPAAYQYLVLPDKSRKEVECFDTGQIKVERNDKSAQIVWIGQYCYVAAYQYCEMVLPDGKEVQIETPGLYLIEMKHRSMRIYAASPGRTKDCLVLNLDGKKVNLSLDKHGFAVQ